MSKKRWGGGGLLLLVLLAVLLAVPLLRHGAGSHPLSATLRTDLCPLLPDPPGALAAATRQPGSRSDRAAACHFMENGSQYTLNVTMTSTRHMSIDAPMRPSRMYELWVAEVKANSGNDLADLPGDWPMGSSYRDRHRQLLLIEDNGVLVTMDTSALDKAQLADYAREVVVALRKAAPERGELNLQTDKPATP